MSMGNCLPLMVTLQSTSPIVERVFFPTALMSLEPWRRGYLLLTICSNTALLSRQSHAPVSRRAFVRTPLIMTGSTHESIGLTLLSLGNPLVGLCFNVAPPMGQWGLLVLVVWLLVLFEGDAAAITSSSWRLGTFCAPINLYLCQ